MKQMKLRKMIEVPAEPEQVFKVIDDECRKDFEADGLVAVCIPIDNGIKIVCYRVDPAKKPYDEWQRELSGRYN